MKTVFFTVLLLFSITTSRGADAGRINIARAMIDSAKTQEDLDHASKMLLETWEEDLQKKEKKMMRRLSKLEAKSFKEAMDLWRSHVEKMSQLRSNLFKKDLMSISSYKKLDLASRQEMLSNARSMQQYVYNMSKAVYYEDKSMEMDALLNPL